jgi:outer membrane protein, heavy metal efflux system
VNVRTIAILRTLSLALLCLAAGAAIAQPSPAPLTIEDAVSLAIRRNPRVSAAAREVTASEAGVRSARALANPSLLFSPALSPGGSDEELLLQQPLELNGTRGARTGVARAQLRAAHAEAVIALRELVFETKAAYTELARAQVLRSLAQEALQTAEEFDRITRRQAELGARPGIDRIQTGIEATRAQQQVTLAESQVTAAQSALNTFMGRPPEEPIGALPPLTVATTPVDREAALRQALGDGRLPAARAEFAAAEANRDGFRQEARLARAHGRPDLVPQFRAGSVTRGFGDAGVAIGITLPLFDYGSRRERVRQAEAAARAQEDRITGTRVQVRQEVEQSLARLSAAEAVVQSYQAGVLDQARRLLEASRTGFQAGATSVIAVLEAQRTYRSVLTEYTNALAAAATARAELERATGAVPADLLPVASPEARRSP